MKQLTLIRHAKSSWEHVGLSDAERPLNRRGEADAPKIGKRLKAIGFEPDLMITSPAVRAATTAEIIAGVIGYPVDRIVRNRALYLAGVEQLLDVIASQAESVNHIVLFGHNPGLTEFANTLAPGVTNNVPTTGVVSVTLDSADWTLYAKLPGTLEFFDYPKKPQA